MLRHLSQRVLARVSRVTSSGRTYLPQIDGLRFVAITWVFAFHVLVYVLGATGQPREFGRSNALIFSFGVGHVGVDLFFVISGFIVSMPFALQYLAAGEEVRAKTYFTRRLTRIEPPYIIHLLVSLAVWALFRKFITGLPFPSHPDYPHHIPAHLLASLFYSHQFTYQALPFPNLALWSLEIEIQFYLLVPLLAFVFTIGKYAWRRTIIAAGMLLFSGISYWGREVFLVTNTLAGCLQEFLAGFLLADLYVTHWRNHADGRYGWDLLSLAAWAGLLFSDCLGWARSFLLPWLILLAYAGVLRGVILNRILGSPWIATIGGMCYTIYMYHGWVIVGLGKATLHMRTRIMWADVLLQTVTLAAIGLLVWSPLFLLFERPFMQPDWHRRLRAALFRRRDLAEVQTP